jgi:hypothetical protein
LVAQRPFKGGKVFLELSGQVSQYQFAWSRDGKTWETLAASGAEDLSKEKAGGFTGTAIGLYATANGKVSQAWADFDWFEMKPGIAPRPAALSPRPTPVPLPAREVWRVRAGGDAMKDSSGNEWLLDQAFSGGETAFTGRPIEAPKDPDLFKSERWGSDFSYVFPVPSGEYLVRLRFAETYLKKPGERVFDVLINGKKVLKGFDILREAKGFDKGIEKTFKSVRPDAEGKIKIRFVSSVQNAKVCTVEVLKK